MKYVVTVSRFVNDQAEHHHVRERSVRESKIEDVFHRIVGEEYDRLARGGSPERIKALEPDDLCVVMYWRPPDNGCSVKIKVRAFSV